MNKTTQEAIAGVVANKVSQKVVFGDEGRKKLLEGAKILAQAVGSTMGPSGHNVILDTTSGVPLVTKDGVTVARSINLKDRLRKMGAELLKEVASKTNDLAGDGPQPIYAKVLTPDGWTTMGELKVGDNICGTNGTIQKVLGVFPKGMKDIYRVSLAEGNKATRFVECSGDHLWAVKTYYGRSKVLTTSQILENGLLRKNNGGNYFIPTTPVQFKDNTAELPLDPYLLGVLLGDGSLSEKSEVEIAIGLNEEYVLDKLILPRGCKLRKRSYTNKHYIKAVITGSTRTKVPRSGLKSNIKIRLKELGLLGTNSHTKFIPKQYLYSSIENRKKLLEGLIDTDGTISKRGLFEFRTVSKQLYLDVIELCRSLGKIIYTGIIKRSLNDGSYSTNPIFRITELKGNKYGLKIIGIEKVNKQTEMMCIKVSNEDHLYLTDNYVPTHNTTTGTVLGYAMLSEGIKMIATGRDPIKMKKGMDLATREVISYLQTTCTPVMSSEDIINVGTISANGDRRIGELLSQAIEKVGKDGIISIEPGKTANTVLEVVEGMQFDGGYLSPYFVTNSDKNIVEFLNPFILMTNRKISSLNDFLPILEKVANANRPLLVIAEDVEGEALHTLIVNKFQGVLASCAVKAPSYGENRTDILGDIAAMVGGNVLDLSNPSTLANLDLSDLGIAKKIVVTRSNTTIVGELSNERKEAVSSRVQGIKNALENDKTLDELRVDRYRKRLAKLAGGVALIKVGGSTEVEIFERKDRVEDALNATLAAAQEGIVPGGGTALYHCSNTLEKKLKKLKLSDDEMAGVQVILNACKTPLETIVSNTGKSPAIVMDKLKNKPKVGYNAATDTYGDLLKEGIIDPVKVTRYAIEHASSVVGLILTCNAIVVNETEEE